MTAPAVPFLGQLLNLRGDLGLKVRHPAVPDPQMAGHVCICVYYNILQYHMCISFIYNIYII